MKNIDMSTLSPEVAAYIRSLEETVLEQKMELVKLQSLTEQLVNLRKKYGYRNGIQTDLGDIRNDVWLDLVRELIVRSHEEDLFDKLLEWEKEHTYWLKTKAELEHYTLELYAARIFDNPKWVDYEAFAKHYGYQPQSYEG